MSKLKKSFGKRVLAYVLAGAMIVSGTASPGITAFASEALADTRGGIRKITKRQH